MNNKIIDGNVIAEKILAELKEKEVPNKFLGVFCVFGDSATKSFIKKKKEFADKLGVDFRIYEIDEDINNDDLRKRIRQVSSMKKCGGVILQLPVPENINSDYVINTIPNNKDIEVMTSKTIGDFYNGRSLIYPPSVQTVIEILKYLKIDLKDIKKVAVVGLGKLVGRPIHTYFSNKTSEIIGLDKGFDISELEDVDLVVSGAGVPNLIDAGKLKKDAIFIDFGYSKNKDSKLVGDLSSNSIKSSDLKYYTPTPGGTGPILVASLFKNFYKRNSNK